VAHVNHLGPKIKGISREHTIIGYAQSPLRKIGGWGEVERIVTGPITAGRTVRGIRVWHVDAGLKVKIWDTIASQIFFLYTHQRETVIERLRAEFELCEVVS